MTDKNAEIINILRGVTHEHNSLDKEESVVDNKQSDVGVNRTIIEDNAIKQIELEIDALDELYTLEKITNDPEFQDSIKMLGQFEFEDEEK